MDLYNIGTYLHIMTGAFKKGHGSQSGLGIEFFDVLGKYVVTGGKEMIFDDAKISLMANHKAEVRKEIVEAADGILGHHDLIDIYNQEIKPDVNSLTVGVCCTKLNKIIQSDPNIPDSTKAELDKYLTADQDKFIVESFRTSLAMKNTNDRKVMENNDIPYLSEVNGECPVCHYPLIGHEAKRKVCRYEIVSIYDDSLPDKLKEEIKEKGLMPKNVYTPKNKLALCCNCAADYLDDPDYDKYAKLLGIRKEIDKREYIQEQLDGLDVEKEISEFLKALDEFSAQFNAGVLSLQPIPLKNKIPASEAVFLATIQMWVNQYYKYIEERLSTLDGEGKATFDLIANQVKTAFLSLDKEGKLSHEEVFYALSNWLCKKIGYPSEKVTVASIVVAFFVQNCEVFYEIA